MKARTRLPFTTSYMEVSPELDIAEGMLNPVWLMRLIVEMA